MQTIQRRREEEPHNISTITRRTNTAFESFKARKVFNFSVLVEHDKRFITSHKILLQERCTSYGTIMKTSYIFIIYAFIIHSKCKTK